MVLCVTLSTGDYILDIIWGRVIPIQACRHKLLYVLDGTKWVHTLGLEWRH